MVSFLMEGLRPIFRNVLDFAVKSAAKLVVHPRKRLAFFSERWYNYKNIGNARLVRRGMDGRKRCRWCNTRNPLYVAYHDSEWGVPHFDDRYLYEMLLLESFQAGLSFECILNKREGFRRAYDGFDLDRVVLYGEAKVRELLCNSEIVRNRRKIEASIKNSRVFKDITREYGSFRAYLEGFTGGRTLYETGAVKNALSDALSRDLQNRGMTFVGSVILYSYLQAIGVIVSHEEDCYLHKGE